MKWVVLLLSLLSLGGCGECPVCPKPTFPEEYEVMPIQTWYDLTYRGWDPDMKNGLRLSHSLITSIGGSYFSLFHPTERTMNVEIWDMVKRTKVWGDDSASSYFGHIRPASYVYLGSKLYFFRVGSGGLTLSSFDPATGTVSNHQTHALDFTTSSSDYPYGVIYCDETLKKVFYAWNRYRSSSSNVETINVWQYDTVADLASEITTISGTDYLANSIGSDGTYLYLVISTSVLTNTARKITISDGTVTTLTPTSIAPTSFGHKDFFIAEIGPTTVVVGSLSLDINWTVATDMYRPNESYFGCVAFIDDTKGLPYRVVLGYRARLESDLRANAIKVLSLNGDGSVTVHRSTYDSSFYLGGIYYAAIGPMLGHPGGFRNQMIASHPYATGFQIDYHKVSVE
jgi:hypothetical protein